MKTMLGTMSASAAVLSALTFLTVAAPAAQAGEYCITNSNGMRGCGFATMEQCKATASGINGTCARDPFLATASNTNPRNALAYQPKRPHAKRSTAD